MNSGYGRSLFRKIWTGWQVRLLLVLFIVQVFAIMILGLSGQFGVIGRSWTVAGSQPVMAIQEWRENATRDPKIGTVLSQIPYVDDEGKQSTIPRPGRPAGLIFIASCTECVAPELLRWNEIHKNHPESAFYIVPTKKDLDVIQNFKKKHRIDLPFIVEDNGRLAELCNPYFLPRIYLLGATGKFALIQSPEVSSKDTLTQVGKSEVVVGPSVTKGK